jgi:hypothetical protein
MSDHYPLPDLTAYNRLEEGRWTGGQRGTVEYNSHPEYR